MNTEKKIMFEAKVIDKLFTMVCRFPTAKERNDFVMSYNNKYWHKGSKAYSIDE